MSHLINKDKNIEGEAVLANIWVCSTCRQNHVAVEVNPGNTPELIPCQKEGCEGIARSLSYPLFGKDRNKEVAKSAMFEFYRPKKVKAKEPYSVDLNAGVLKIRPRTSEQPILVNMYREWRNYCLKQPPTSLKQHQGAEDYIKANSKKKLYL